MLSVIGERWPEHLYEMEYLKEGNGLRAMAQRDPLASTSVKATTCTSRCSVRSVKRP